MKPLVLTIVVLAGIIVGIILLFLVMYCCLNNCCVVVHQEKGAVTERFGKMNAVFTPGVNCKMPCIDKFKEFKWSRPMEDMMGRKDESFTFIDMREDAYPLPEMQVYTKDAIPLSVTVFLIYNFDDVKKCFYEVDNLSVAIYNTVQAQINELFAEYLFEECMICQKRLNDLAMERYAATFDSWGVKLHSMQILDIMPDDNLQVSLLERIETERQRRAELIMADANSECTKLLSEGEKIVLENNGIGTQQEIKNQSEGQSKSAEIVTQADADALNLLRAQLSKENVDYADYQMADRYIDTVFASQGTRELSLGLFKPSIEGAFRVGFQSSEGGTGGAIGRSELD